MTAPSPAPEVQAVLGRANPALARSDAALVQGDLDLMHASLLADPKTGRTPWPFVESRP